MINCEIHYNLEIMKKKIKIMCVIFISQWLKIIIFGNIGNDFTCRLSNLSIQIKELMNVVGMF